MFINISRNTRWMLYGGGSGVCVYFDNAYIVLVCDALLCLERLETQATWAPKGLSLRALWHPFGSLGMPAGPFGAPWALKGSF